MSEKYEKVHKAYIEVDSIASKINPSDLDVESWKEVCDKFRKAYARLGWAEDNNQIHQLTAHGHKFLDDPRVKSLGLLTLKGLERGNFFFNKEKSLHTFKGDVMLQLEQLFKIEVVNSSPVLQRQLLYNKQVRHCSRCGQEGHREDNRNCPALFVMD